MKTALDLMKWQAAMLAIFATATLLQGCLENVRPQNTTEQLYIAQITLTGATNALADLKGVLEADDYDNAKDLVLLAADALDCAKAAANVPGAVKPAICPAINTGAGAIGYLQTMNDLLIQAAAYYAAREG